MKNRNSIPLTVSKALKLRQFSQRLVTPENGSPPETPDAVVSELLAVQAQDLPQAVLGVGLRGSGFDQAAVYRALQDGRRLLRTWLLRGTLHLATAADAAWLLPLLAPDLIHKGKRRLKQLGWDDDRLHSGLRLLEKSLETQETLTRRELAERLRLAGLPHEGQAPVHLVYRAALEGMLCCAPDQDGQVAYTRLETWAGLLRPGPREQAVVELARRYLNAYAPASAADFAHWSGLPLAEARRAFQALERDCIEAAFNGQKAVLLENQLSRLDEPEPPAPVVRLLPRFDLYLLGYKDRSLVLEAQYAKRVHPGGGMILTALLVDGVVRGAWNMKPRRRQVEVVIEPFEPLSEELVPALTDEVQRLGNFLGMEAVMRIAESGS
ncbi:MAG: winged helix DNA-binding domain-containing protein [Chloroflexi bacterium]|nr:winged helix DNA-binding domain-containing protein [Chloroflexota bacterium]